MRAIRERVSRCRRTSCVLAGFALALGLLPAVARAGPKAGFELGVTPFPLTQRVWRSSLPGKGKRAELGAARSEASSLRLAWAITHEARREGVDYSEDRGELALAPPEGDCRETRVYASDRHARWEHPGRLHALEPGHRPGRVAVFQRPPEGGAAPWEGWRPRPSLPPPERLSAPWSDEVRLRVPPAWERILRTCPAGERHHVVPRFRATRSGLDCRRLRDDPAYRRAWRERHRERIEAVRAEAERRRRREKLERIAGWHVRQQVALWRWRCSALVTVFHDAELGRTELRVTGGDGRRWAHRSVRDPKGFKARALPLTLPALVGDPLVMGLQALSTGAIYSLLLASAVI